jgi:hypothetical protein
MSESGEYGPETGVGDQPPRVPYWVTPENYGAAEALTSVGTVAAPLLAGFSLAAMAQTLTLTPNEVRWPDAALLLFLLAATLFIAAVQATFWARQYQTSPHEIMAWWPDAKDRLSLLQREQERHAAGFRMWSNRARAAYNAGLLCLLAGLTALSVPGETRGHVPVLRWVGVAVGVIAFIAEAAWIAGTLNIERWKWAAKLLTP